LFGRRSGVLGATEPGAFYLGRYWDKDRQEVGEKLHYGGAQSIVVIGRNRSGKDARLGNYNGLQLDHKSLIYVDPRGEAAAISAPYRRRLGPVFMLNPFGVLADIPGYEDLRSDGFNPLAALDPDSPRFFDDASGIAEALIKVEGKDPHWSQRARGLALGFLMDEVKRAKRELRMPSLFDVRTALTEPDVRDPKTDRLVKGLAVTAERLARQGDPQIASLLAGFTADNDEVGSVRATADGQTQWLLSKPMRDDMAKGGVDWRLLGDRTCTVYVILPPEMVETHSIWLRLVIAAAMRALYRPRPDGVVCAFWLNEFAALGRLQPIEAALGLTAGYGVQLIPILQSLTQLKLHYEDGWENFLGQAGAVVGVGPPADWFTADWMSRRSGETTIRQPNANTSFNPGGTPGFSLGESFGRRNYLMPQDLFGMREGFGLTWCAGLANPIPAYLPPYWDVEQLARRARRNPFYRG
jgi:type IV secretion system protein VirD4